MALPLTWRTALFLLVIANNRDVEYSTSKVSRNPRNPRFYGKCLFAGLGLRHGQGAIIDSILTPDSSCRSLRFMVTDVHWGGVQESVSALEFRRERHLIDLGGTSGRKLKKSGFLAPISYRKGHLQVTRCILTSQRVKGPIVCHLLPSYNMMIGPWNLMTRFHATPPSSTFVYMAKTRTHGVIPT